MGDRRGSCHGAPYWPRALGQCPKCPTGQSAPALLPPSAARPGSLVSPGGPSDQQQCPPAGWRPNKAGTGFDQIFNLAIIKSGISFQDQPWHSECFVCTNCKKKLVGQEFTSNDEDPYCLDCFGNLYAKKCTACAKPITGQGGAKYISFEDDHWHTDCFNCTKCTHSLIGQKFLQGDNGILCLECGHDL